MTKVLIVSTDPYEQLEERLNVLNEKFPEEQFEFYIVNETFGYDPPTNLKYKKYVSLTDFADDKEIERVLIQAEEWAPFDYSIQTDEYAVSLLAKLNLRLHLNGLTMKQAIAFRDKVRMKQLLAEDICKPKLYNLQDLLNNSINYPVIVKPRSFAASKGIYVAENKEELLTYIKSKNINYNNNSLGNNEASINDIEIEEYIDADVYHIDGLIYHNRIIFCNASRYIGSCFHYAQGEVLGSIRASKSEQKKWLEFVEKVHRDLKIPDGAFHLEGFFKNEECIFLEIGARPGGAGVVPSIKAAFGIDLTEEHMLCQLGIEPTIINDINKNFGWLVFPKQFNDNSLKYVKSVILPTTTPLSLYTSKIPEINEKANADINYSDTLGSFIFLLDDQVQLENDMYTYIKEYKVVIE